MCLLIVFSQMFPELPLVVAANRDEWLARPATTITVLHPESPRILGGRDELAGGTWMATNDAGVVAGLTNRPPGPAGRLARRSRGELPLFLAGRTSAAVAADEFARAFRPADYNPSWILVGDRDSLHHIDMSSGGGEDTPALRALSPGLHILENRELDADSPKNRHVRRLLAGIEQCGGAELVTFLADVLRNHEIPEGAENSVPREDGFIRPLATEAACVHAGPYGTRSASIVLVPRDRSARPKVHVARGRPCETPFEDVSALWDCGG
jgi:uncharacterized protein with NRDE domain